MNCQSFELIVNDLAREEITEATVREEALTHLAGCQECAASLQDAQSLTQRLRALASSMQAETAPQRIEASLIDELRSQGAKHVSQQATRVSSEVLNMAPRRRSWSYAALAAAAIVIVVVGAIAVRFVYPRGGSDFVAVTGENAAPVSGAKNVDAGSAVSETVQGSPKNAEQSREGASPPQSLRSLRSSRSSPAFARYALAAKLRPGKNTVTVRSLDILAGNYDEVSTEFIPIAFSNAANAQEAGQVVRLELTRYAMARFGVPVNMERYDERVKADIWLGADGLARAIRFVQ